MSYAAIEIQLTKLWTEEALAAVRTPHRLFRFRAVSMELR